MTDEETLTQEALIKEIAVKHGITVGRDDPILILQTMTARLTDNNAKAQQVMLQQYKEDLEGVALRWGNDAKDKSERILSASLTAGRDVMANLLQDCTKTTTMTVQKEVDQSLSRAGIALGRVEKVAMINLFASAITLMAACAIVVAIVFR